jgi:hypothetical protein
MGRDAAGRDGQHKRGGGLGVWGGILAGTLVGIWRVHRAGAQ